MRSSLLGIEMILRVGEYASRLPCLGDSRRLQQALINLVTNRLDVFMSLPVSIGCRCVHMEQGGGGREC
jgi:C4-dicarboxylate-specific signal transduction histidine kinase